MTNTTKSLLNAEEIRLTRSRRTLIAGIDRVTERLETRSFALSDQDVLRLTNQLELLQNRLGDVNDRLYDLQVAKAKKRVSSFKVTFPDVEKGGQRRTRLCN